MPAGDAGPIQAVVRTKRETGQVREGIIGCTQGFDARAHCGSPSVVVNLGIDHEQGKHGETLSPSAPRKR
jgi:hypothetical protein